MSLALAAQEAGWRVVVLAGPEEEIGRRDPSLAARIPSSLEVIRPAAWARPGHPLWARVPPDSDARWAMPAALRALEAHRTQRFDLVFSTSTPYSDHLVGWWVHERASIPWIADLRDPWTDSALREVYRSRRLLARARNRLERWVEARVLSSADLITVTCEPFAELLSARRLVPADRIHTIYNGFDGPVHDPGASPARSAGPRRFVFTGSAYGDYNLGPAMAAFELALTRDATAELEMHVVGQASEWVQRHLHEYPKLAARTVTSAAVPHSEALRLMRNADVLFLVAPDRLSVPGKLFEYLQAGPPILAFVAPGTDCERILSRTGAGRSTPFDDRDRAASAVLEALSGRGFPGRRAAEIDSFARARASRRMLELFEQLAIA